MKKTSFKKIIHLDDFMSDENTVMSTHIISFGDDVYHDHDFYEISYLLNGKISHYVNEQPMDLVSGDIVFFRPQDRHIFIRNDDNNAKHRDVLFRKDFFKSVLDFLCEDFAFSYSSPLLPIKINLPLEKLEEIENSINNYYLLTHDDSNNKLLLAKFILIQLLNCLQNNIMTKKEKENEYPLWFNDLLQKINMWRIYKEGLSSITAQFDYSKSYMCNMFKKYMGVTMTDYLNDLRLSYAASQIKLTNNSILNISMEAGFYSISYFNKLFKQKYHCTPKKYKNFNKKQIVSDKESNLSE